MKPVVSSSMRPMSPAFSHCSYVRISHASSHTPPFAPSFNSGTKTESSHFRKCCFFTGSWQVGSWQEKPCAIISAALPPPPPAWQIGIIELCPFLSVPGSSLKYPLPPSLKQPVGWYP